jgi:hypothetical protein
MLINADCLWCDHDRWKARALAAESALAKAREAAIQECVEIVDACGASGYRALERAGEQLRALLKRAGGT